MPNIWKIRSAALMQWLIIMGTAGLGMHTGFARSSAPAPSDEIYHYTEVTGKRVKDVTWRLSKGEIFVLTYSSSGEQHVTVTSPGYDTIRWKVVDASDETDLSAARDDDISPFAAASKTCLAPLSYQSL